MSNIGQNIIKALIAIGLTGAASTALSDPLTADTSRADAWLIAKYDTDGDQVISCDEISEKRERMFGYMDLDGNGNVTFDEYQMLDTKKREEVLKARFSKLDVDHDGDLSAEEYSTYLGSFDRFDKNGDGKITQKEIEPVKKAQPKPEVTKDNAKCLWRFCYKTDK